MLRKYYPGIHSLRDIDIEQLEKNKTNLPEIVYRRCHFVVKENKRLTEGCSLLTKGDLKGFGQLMYEAHNGLSRWYEVSCTESDFLVAHAKSLTGVVGARQMGGGFGGCTINIVKNDFIEIFTTNIQTAYQKEFSKTPEIYITQIEDGAKVLHGLHE